MDHMRRKTIRLNLIKVVVFDEADEMLNMGLIFQPLCPDRFKIWPRSLWEIPRLSESRQNCDWFKPLSNTLTKSRMAEIRRYIPCFRHPIPRLGDYLLSNQTAGDGPTETYWTDYQAQDNPETCTNDDRGGCRSATLNQGETAARSCRRRYTKVKRLAEELYNYYL